VGLLDELRAVTGVRRVTFQALAGFAGHGAARTYGGDDHGDRDGAVAVPPIAGERSPG